MVPQHTWLLCLRKFHIQEYTLGLYGTVVFIIGKNPCISVPWWFKSLFKGQPWIYTWRRKWHQLQCSCLENPRDGGAWWAAVYGVAQSRTRLKPLSSSSMYIYIYIHQTVAQLVKNLPGSAGDTIDAGSVSGLGRFPGERNGNPPLYSCLENSMDRGSWRDIVHGVSKELGRTERPCACAHTHTHTHTLHLSLCLSETSLQRV